MKLALIPFFLWLPTSFVTSLHGEAFLENATISVEFSDKPTIGDLISGKFIVHNNGATPLKVFLADELNIEVRDRHGHPVPIVPRSGAAAGYLVPLPILIAPGKSEFQEFLLSNYVEIFKPGPYLVSVWSRLGRLDDDPYPVATAKIDFHSPTAKYASDRVHKLCTQRAARDAGYEAGAALERLRDPRYLAPLCREVEAGCPQACFGIASLLGAEPTKILLKLADSPRPQIAKAALIALLSRLPDPDKSKYRGYPLPYRAQLKVIQDTWPTQLEAPLMALVEKILLHTTSADWPTRRQLGVMGEDYFNLSNDNRVSAAAYIVATRGTTAQVPALMAATNHGLSARLEPRLDNYGFDGLPESLRALINAIDALRHRGWVIMPRDTSTVPSLEGSGGALVLLRQLADPDIPKPEVDDWKNIVAEHLTAQSAVIKETALQAIPQPFPADWDSSVIANLEDPDWNVVTAACRAAGGSGRKRFIRPLVQVIESVHASPADVADCDSMRNAASIAAVKLGGGAVVWEAWANVLPEEKSLSATLAHLCTGTIDLPRETGWSGHGETNRSERFLLRDAWREFVQQNRERLDRGERVPSDDPSITPTLTGANVSGAPIISIQFVDGTEWPKSATGQTPPSLPGLPSAQAP